MLIREKIKLDKQGLVNYGPINIVAFGDSITHGAFAPGEIDYEAVYWNRFRKKINSLNPYVPVNVINAGIGGTTAISSVSRLESQVLSHSPDLVIVCFGLNDVNEPLEGYLLSLKEIFARCKQRDVDVVFMTPNMLNTYVSEDVDLQLRDYAQKMADTQNSGKMDHYINSAVDLAMKMDVAVCDCYKEWKNLSSETDTTLLLANRINHPQKQMHELFANCLYNVVFGDTFPVDSYTDTMYGN